MRLPLLLALLPLVPIATAAAAPAPLQDDAALVAQGKEAWEEKCGLCHAVDKPKIGPMHRGVVGRAVASVPGFDYSDALKKLGGVWSPDRIDAYITDPQTYAPGNKMGQSVEDPADRKAIIAYLETLK